MPSALHLACPRIPLVRIALIGLGQRGMKTLERYVHIPGAEIRYMADLRPERLKMANERLRESGRPQAVTFEGEKGWIEACQRNDVDLIYICTEWRTHTQMAVTAMREHKHVAVEVPAATSLDECWQLVHTAEETGRHCFMTENCCYDLFALETLTLHRQGKLGEITHCEGAYIHNLTTASRHASGSSDTRDNWIEQSCALHGGNPYPTHGIGFIAQLLGFHRQDRMERLVSLTADGHKEGEETLGRVNSTLIKTANGVSILLQLDVTTPRPYSRLQTVCGTKGFVQKYPVPTIQLAGSEPLTGTSAEVAMRNYATSPMAQRWLEGHHKGVANEMNYAMDARLIECLQEGMPLDIDVYDAAEWSCLADLTKRSALHGGLPIEIPDFLHPKI